MLTIQLKDTMINRYFLIMCVLIMGCKEDDKLILSSVVLLHEQDSVILFGDLSNMVAYNEMMYAKDFSSEMIYSIPLDNGNVTNCVVKNIPWNSVYNHFKTKYNNQVNFKYAEFDDNQKMFTNGLTCKDVTCIKVLHDTMYAGAYITVVTDSFLNVSNSGSIYNDTYYLSIPFIVRYSIKDSKLYYIDIVDFDFPLNQIDRINLYSFQFIGDKMITLSNSKDEMLIEFNKTHDNMLFSEQIIPKTQIYIEDNYFIPLVKDDSTDKFAYGNMVFDKDLNVQLDLTSKLKQLKILQGHIVALQFTERTNIIIYVDHSLENKYYFLYRKTEQDEWKLIPNININPMSCVFKGNKLYSILSKEDKYELNVYQIN